MRTKAFATIGMVLLTVSFCFSQHAGSPGKPPSLKEQLKRVNEQICTPLNLDKSQTEKVDAAFREFFEGIEKLIDKSLPPPVRPEKSKVDALGKIRDEKVRQIIPESQYAKFLELEQANRPKGPENRGPRTN